MAKFHILSIDGGGIRGIVPGQVLLEIERAFGVRVADRFDLVAGTSTGGILACAYLLPNEQGTPQFTAEEVVNLYFDRGGQIFDIPFFHKIRSLGGISDEKYPQNGLEAALLDYFRDTWLKDLLKPTVITSYDLENRKGHFFYQHKAAQDPAYNFRLTDVARATSAAPTYFECAQVFSEDGTSYPLIDGGVFVNNPTLTAYAESRNIFDVNGRGAYAEDLKILSIGTGFTPKKYPYAKVRNWGMAQWVQPVVDIMMSGSSDVTDYHINRLFGTIEHPEQYLRINGPIPPDVDPDMDNAKPENLEALRAFGKSLFDKNRNQIEYWLSL